MTATGPALDTCASAQAKSQGKNRAVGGGEAPESEGRGRSALLDILGESAYRLLEVLGDDMDTRSALLQGTLDLLVLKAVSLGPTHGYGILLRIQQVSREILEIPQGSLYPALYRLEHRQWIKSTWGESTNKRKAKFY